MSTSEESTEPPDTADETVKVSISMPRSYREHLERKSGERYRRVNISAFVQDLIQQDMESVQEARA